LANLESRAGFVPGIAFAFDVRGEESGSARILIAPVGPIPEEAVTRIFEPQTVSFTLGTCDFDQNIMVPF
jgi:hypothetical protein